MVALDAVRLLARQQERIFVALRTEVAVLGQPPAGALDVRRVAAAKLRETCRNRLARPNMAGRRMRETLFRHLGRWLDRTYGVLSFHLV